MSGIALLFWTFFQIGLLSIGGGYAIIPLIQEQVVHTHAWLSQRMFTDIITISQMTPGPLAVNTSTFVGLQIGGPAGAVAATLGCVAAGVILSMLLYSLIRKYSQSAIVLKILNGLKASSVGLIASAAATILLLTFFGTDSLEAVRLQSLNWTAVGIFLVCLVIVRKWHLNPIALMGGCGLVGLFFFFL